MFIESSEINKQIFNEYFSKKEFRSEKGTRFNISLKIFFDV